MIGVAVLAAIVFGAIKSTDVYKGALARAQSDSRVTAAIGSPVRARWFVRGNVSVENQRGNADISLPIRGSRGKGTIHAVATRDESGWHYSELTVHIDNTPPIDLLR